jgi:hypothetical protein
MAAAWRYAPSHCHLSDKPAILPKTKSRKNLRESENVRTFAAG